MAFKLKPVFSNASKNDFFRSMLSNRFWYLNPIFCFYIFLKIIELFIMLKKREKREMYAENYWCDN